MPSHPDRVRKSYIENKSNSEIHKPLTKYWSLLGFWKFSCGCLQFQDGYELCCKHKTLGYQSLLNEDCIDVTIKSQVSG